MVAKVIAVANQKGGAGKSSSVIMLGSELPIMAKSKVLLIDTDPQRSLGKIFDHENEMKPFACSWLDLSGMDEDADGLVEEIKHHINDYDYIILDLRGKLDGYGINEKIMFLADLIVTPVQCDQNTIDATIDTINYYIDVVCPKLEGAGITPPEMRTWWLLPKPSELLAMEKLQIEQFDKDMAELGIKSFKEPLHYWSEIKASLMTSTPVSAVNSGGKATKSIRATCKEIIDILR